MGFNSGFKGLISALDVSGQLRDPAALPQEKEPPVANEMRRVTLLIILSCLF